MTLLSFHNDESIKKKYIDRVKAHREADNIIQGTGWESGKGCAVGCTLENYNHSQYPIELGIPEWLARLEDEIFEGLSSEEAMDWPLLFLEAIPVGVELEQIKIPFLIMVIESTLECFDYEKYPDPLNCVNKVISLLKDENSTEEEYEKAAKKAFGTAYAANAYAAAYAASAYAAAYAASA